MPLAACSGMPTRAGFSALVVGAGIAADGQIVVSTGPAQQPGRPEWEREFPETRVDGIATSRLDLLPATVPRLEAELESDARLGLLLDAQVPYGWPPGEYDGPAIRYFLERLIENPDAVGWYGWYALLRSSAGGSRILVGAGGFFGPPNAEGLVEIGYSVLPAFEGRGFATELVRALVEHAFSDRRVRRIVAHTTKENIGSIKVLQRAGFTFAGTDQETGTVEYARQSPAA